MNLQGRKNNNYKLVFQCSDVGQRNDCDWQVSGTSEEELMPKIEQHGREKHNLKSSLDGASRKKVCDAIRKAA